MSDTINFESDANAHVDNENEWTASVMPDSMAVNVPDDEEIEMPVDLFNWLCEVLPQMVTRDTDSFCIVSLKKNGETESAYWNTSTSDRSVMINALMNDNFMDMVSDNADEIRDILGLNDDEY